MKISESRLGKHPYDLDRAKATCVNEADFDSEFVQAILAADASVFDVGEDCQQDCQCTTCYLLSSPENARRLIASAQQVKLLDTLDASLAALKSIEPDS